MYGHDHKTCYIIASKGSNGQHGRMPKGKDILGNIQQTRNLSYLISSPFNSSIESSDLFMCNCNLQPLDWDLGDSWGMIKLSHLFTYSNAHQSFHKKCGGMYRNQTPQLISCTVTTADILRMQTIFNRKLHIK